MKILLLLISLTFVTATSAVSQECTDENKAALHNCHTQCQTACDTEFAGCEKPVVTLEELREAINAQCSCDTARNFGKYRSCVAHIVNALKKFQMIEEASWQAIQSDNAQCKSQIKENKRLNKGKGGQKKGQAGKM